MAHLSSQSHPVAVVVDGHDEDAVGVSVEVHIRPILEGKIGEIAWSKVSGMPLIYGIMVKGCVHKR